MIRTGIIVGGQQFVSTNQSLNVLIEIKIIFQIAVLNVFF